MNSSVKSIHVLTFLLCVLLVTAPVLAIEFDAWHTGMTLTEIVETARVHDIPLQQTGLLAQNKGFNEQTINDRFWKSPTVGYVTQLLGVNSSVIMKIAQEWPRRLYEIEIRMTGARTNKQFNAELLSMLTNKYGPPRKTFKSFKEAYQWNPNDTDQIMLTLYSAPHLTYTDVPYKNAVNVQSGNKYQNQMSGYIRKDADKF